MKESKRTTVLRSMRDQRGWSRQRLAEVLNALIGEDDTRSPITTQDVGRWERGEHIPHPYWRERLCKVYNRDAASIGLIESPASADLAETAPQGLILEDLGIDSPFWESVHYLRFTLANAKQGVIFVDHMDLNVLYAEPCEYLWTHAPGAILKIFEFAVELDSAQNIYQITDDFFTYKPGDIDGFRIKLTSKQFFLYDVQLEAHWHFVGTKQEMISRSEIHTISFPIQNADDATTLLRERLRRDES